MKYFLKYQIRSISCEFIINAYISANYNKYNLVCRFAGNLWWEWMLELEIYFYMRLFCIIILYSLLYVFMYFTLNKSFMLFFFQCLFLYHCIFGLQTLMVWLWGVNLWVFSHSSVNYSKIFDLDNNHHLSHIDIWKVSLIIIQTACVSF